MRNKSERFEARAAMVKINDTNSLWFKGMAGSHMPIAVSHGEGRVEFKTPENLTALQAQNLIVAQYIDSHLKRDGNLSSQPEWFGIRDYRNF